MTREFFLTDMLGYLEMFPAAAICLFPMKNRLHFSKRRTALHVLIALGILIPFMVILDHSLELSYNSLTLPILAGIFAIYVFSLHDVLFSQAVSVFVLACAVFSFINNTANGIDALLHPASNLERFSTEAAVIQLLISIAVALLLYRPLTTHGAFLIEHFKNSRVWYLVTLIAALFLGQNLLFVLHYYQTMYYNNVARAYWGLIIIQSVMLIAFCIFFYFIVKGMLHSAEIENRRQLLEMQEDLFLRQQTYLDESSRARHDFRQNLRTMQMLANEGDLPELTKYLQKYMEALPENNIKPFCRNRAVNALLNYYYGKAEETGIPTDFSIDLSGAEDLPETVLCTILGNILENALNACTPLQEGDRFIRLSIRALYGKELYISAVNSTEEEKKRRIFAVRAESDDRIFADSANRENRLFSALPEGEDRAEKSPAGSLAEPAGHGIGLRSVTAAAEYLGGHAEFSRKDNEFYSDVMIPLG